MERIAPARAHLADGRNRDHVAFVRSTDQHTAIERLDSLGIGDARVQSARDVKSDVVSAQRETFRVNEAAADEHRRGRRAGAHIDDSGAEIGLVIGEHRQAGHVRARDHRLDGEMTALDASIRLRAAATSVVATCMSTPNRDPSMPRGSRMPLPPSIE